ncbi:Gram-negative bacterial tonB protein [compost metagenome]
MKKAGINNDKVLVDLKHQLNQKIKNKERFRELPWQKLSVAATVAAVVCIGAFYIIKKQQHEKQLIAERFEVPKMLSKNDTLLIYLPDERIIHTAQIAKSDLKRFNPQHEIQADYKKTERLIVADEKPVAVVAAAPALAESAKVALSDSNYLAGKVSKDLTNANSRAALSKAFSSAIQVNGNVIDILSSDPIPDVVVIVKGTEVKTESNDQGAFNISIPNDKQQLELSKKGYSSLTIKATEITDGKLTVGLLPDVRLMAEKAIKDYLANTNNKTDEAKLAVSASAYQIYINKHIAYPKAYTEMGREGTVEVGFTVNADGSLSDFKVLRSMGADFDNPSVEVLKNGPKWLPALKSGKPVKSRQHHYVNFIHI